MAVSSSKISSSGVVRGATAFAYSDLNSLVPGRLELQSWRLTAPTMAPRTRPIYAESADRDTRSLIWVNYDSYCPGGGYLGRPFTVPTGVTAIAIEIDEVQLPTGTPSTNAFQIQLYDASGITQISATSITPTATPTDVTSGTIAVTAGNEYRIRVACNISGQSTFVCGRLRVRPVTSSDSFWTTPFVRIDADHSIILDSNESGWANPRFPQQSEFAHIDIMTDARKAKVEYFQNIEDFISTPRGAPSVFVDGEPIDPPLTTTTGAVSFPEVTIPAGARRTRELTFYAGPQAATGLPAPALENRGTFLCGIYLPASANYEVLPERSAASSDLYVIYGDSKAAGYYSASPGRDSLAFIMRRQGARVISHSAGSATIYADVGSTVGLAACLPLARKLCRRNPDFIVLEMGRNDFVTQRYTPANLVTQIGHLLDAINQVSPRCRVKLLTFTHETTENAVAGTTWDAERAAIAALATTRAWVTVVDGARYWSVAEAPNYTTDNVHPNDAGQERVARGVLGEEYAWSPLQVSTLTAWWDGTTGLVGGAPGAVTAAGASPPTVTLSGTPAIAVPLRIAVKTAGALVTSKFEWSIDDGRSQVQRNVSTGASVLLAPLGVTANFSAGTYPNNAVYTSNMTASQWNDKSGKALIPAIAQEVASRRPAYASLAPNAPGLLFTSAGSQRLYVTGISIPAPFTVYVVGRCTAQTPLKSLIGSATGGACPVLYANTGTTMALTMGSGQISTTVDATALHTYICTLNGASSSLRVDGTSTSGSVTTNTMTEFYLGGSSNPSAGYWDGYVNEVMIFSGVLSNDECMALEARARLRWGTP